jgi:hypothetical protein
MLARRKELKSLGWFVEYATRCENTTFRGENHGETRRAYMEYGELSQISSHFLVWQRAQLREWHRIDRLIHSGTVMVESESPRIVSGFRSNLSGSRYTQSPRIRILRDIFQVPRLLSNLSICTFAAISVLESRYLIEYQDILIRTVGAGFLV